MRPMKVKTPDAVDRGVEEVISAAYYRQSGKFYEDERITGCYYTTGSPGYGMAVYECLGIHVRLDVHRLTLFLCNGASFKGLLHKAIG
ncbi:hypothetical protein CEXT_196221 [Caerostris extrusa]|uniref:Uncharacterized protein n=1 Tax=Caerostris extrusa TaxID=172846 RepID=A0AAV4VJS5_CAEEX|nr:hypothetical protein CEXT_196221 [Caerostris extrusa]